MWFIELKFLILAQIGIDIILIVLFILLVKRLGYLGRDKTLHRPVEMFESILMDADKIAGEFKTQLEEKHRLVKSLNEQLDKRIISLSVLLNRADVLNASCGRDATDDTDKTVSFDKEQGKIVELARKGHTVEKIAEMLSIPKGEVKLVLQVKEVFPQVVRVGKA